MQFTPASGSILDGRQHATDNTFRKEAPLTLHSISFFFLVVFFNVRLHTAAKPDLLEANHDYRKHHSLGQGTARRDSSRGAA
jgi:hypothetical protein